MSFSWSSLKFKPDKTFIQALLLLVSLFVISCLPLFLGFILKNADPEEYGLITGHKEDLEITYKEILFFATVVIACFLLSVAFRYVKNKLLKFVLIAFGSLYLFATCFIVLTDVIYYLIFTCRISFSAIQTILNTNPDEVTGFVKLYYSPGKIIAILLFVFFITMIIFKRAWFINLFSTRFFFISSLVLSIFGIIDFGQVSYSKSNGPHNVRYWDVVIGEYNEYKEFNRRLAAEKNNQNLSKEYDSFYEKDTLQKTLVFVISESLSKRHMSLYGYPRSTTPNLDTNKNIFKFNNCVSQSALTIEAVPGMFFNGY
ncbi:MAG: sulfatase-like hydrolase/transferase, partial [Bacteroidia bacterium]